MYVSILNASAFRSRFIHVRRHRLQAKKASEVAAEEEDPDHHEIGGRITEVKALEKRGVFTASARG